MARLPELLLIVPDGLNGGRLQVLSAQMRWGYGTDLIQPVRVVHQDGSAYSLDGAVAAIMAFYENDTDDEPLTQIEWEITGDNTADFSFLRAMASLLPVTDRGYCVGVRFRDDDTEYEDVVSLAGRAVIDRRMGSFEEPIAVIESGVPLARGPRGQGYTERGLYDNAATYVPYDVVSHELDGATSTYVCILETTGNAPPNVTYWTLWASGASASSNTLAGVYDAGSSAADQTIQVAADKGGTVIVQAAAPATGSLLKLLTSAAAALLDLTDNAAQTIKSAIADGVGAVAHEWDTINTLADATAKIGRWRNNTVERMALYASGKLELNNITLDPVGGLSGVYPMVKGTITDGYFGVTADGVGSLGGTGLLMKANAATPTAATLYVIVANAIQAYITSRYFRIEKMLGHPQISGNPLALVGNTIAPTELMHFLSSGGLIKTITPPATGAGSFTFWLLPTEGSGGFSWDNTGNIYNPGVGQINRAVCFHYTGSVWFADYTIGQDPGADLTVSSNAISPTNYQHNVGAGLIKTINLPFLKFYGSIVLLPTAAFTWDATGNILGSGTAEVGRALLATYNGTKWSIAAAGAGDMALGSVQTVTAAKTFNAGTLKQNNAGNTFAHTLASLATAARTWSLPDVDDTGVGLDAAQTLTNKTISGGSNTLSNIAQASVTNLVSDLSTLTSAVAARLPLAGGTMSGAITLSGTQLGTYSLGGTPTLASALAIGTDGLDIGSLTMRVDLFALTMHSGASTATLTSTVAAGSSAFVVNHTNGSNDPIMEWRQGDVRQAYVSALGTGMRIRAGATKVAMELDGPDANCNVFLTTSLASLNAGASGFEVQGGVLSANTALAASGTSTAFKITTRTVNWSTNNDKFLDCQTNTGVSKFSISVIDTGAGVKLSGPSTAALSLDGGGTLLGSATTAFTTSFNISNGFEWIISTAQAYRMDTTSFENSTDVAKTLGNTTRRWKGALCGFYDTKEGAQLTAAATITPTTGQHHVTGGTTIDTIATTNVGGSNGNCDLLLFADGGIITISNAGNVMAPGGTLTIAQDKSQLFRWSTASSKWYPHQ